MVSFDNFSGVVGAKHGTRRRETALVLEAPSAGPSSGSMDPFQTDPPTLAWRSGLSRKAVRHENWMHMCARVAAWLIRVYHTCAS